jgi:hypothetical protein
MPTLDNDKVLEDSKATAHLKTDEDMSLAQNKKKRDIGDDAKEFDQEERGNFLKNFITKYKDEIKMIYNFYDGS